MIQLKRLNVVREVASEEAASKLEREGFTRIGGSAESKNGNAFIDELYNRVMERMTAKGNQEESPAGPFATPEPPTADNKEAAPAETASTKGKAKKTASDKGLDKEETADGSGTAEPDRPDSPE
ncbi:hypothetical protein AALB39_18110 [Lachnospiraceae bacterium 54-53]